MWKPGQECNIWWTMMKTGARKLNTGTCFSGMWWTSWGKVSTWQTPTQRRRSTGQWGYWGPMHSRLNIHTLQLREHLARQCTQPSPSCLTPVSAMQGEQDTCNLDKNNNHFHLDTLFILTTDWHSELWLTSKRVRKSPYSTFLFFLEILKGRIFKVNMKIKFYFARCEDIKSCWFFQCSCPRCVSISELGTNLSAGLCQLPGCDGPVLPVDTSLDCQLWSCGLCGHQVDRETVSDVVKELGNGYRW